MTSKIAENNDLDEDQNKEKIYFLSDESFTLLREAQQRINEATEMTPTLRKMINELVTQEAVERLTKRFIDQLK